MMMTTRNDIKDRLIHNQSPYPTKDKVLSYTIPVDHSDTLLFCSSNSGGSSSSSSSSSSGSTSSVGANNNQDNGSLSFITTDDDPCNGRDSLASFLDEGLGTSLDGVDEISSPIFPTLGRNDSGVFSSDEGTGGVPAGRATTPATVNSSLTHNHANLNPRLKLSSTSVCGSGNVVSSSCSSNTNHTNATSVAEVVNWKSCSSANNGSVTTSVPNGSIVLSPSGATATISLVTDSVTGIPSIICTSTAPPPAPSITNNSGTTTNSSNNSSSSVSTSEKAVKQTTNSSVNSVVASVVGKGNSSQQQPRTKSMPLGRQGPQKCTICDKVFSNASALTKHKLTHSDERRHACATCGKAFKRQDHLNGHMLTHRNKKPFECKSKGCGKSYCDARSLRRHVENRHGHEVLESMNLTSHKHGNKNSHNNSHNHNNNNGNANNSNQNSNEPQPELMHVTPVKVEAAESNNSSPKTLDCMPVLQPEPQLQLEPNQTSSSNNSNGSCNSSRDKPVGQVSKGPTITLSSAHGLPPPVLQKIGENNVPSTATHVLAPSVVSGGVPVVVKRENVSVFDFDESVEDNGPNVAFTSAPCSVPSSLPPQPEKLLSSAIKVSGIIDSSKLSSLADIRLIQEWTKRLGDSKVALFLASSSGGAPSIAQFAGPMTTASIQLDGHGSTGGTMTMPGSSHAFIPTSENGLFSVTPISIVPTSSGEFAFKPATLSSVPASSTESPKPIYILPPEPLVSTCIPPASHLAQSNLPPPKLGTPQTNGKGSTKESKTKAENKEKKSGIGATLANRIKTKLKAGNMKKLGKTSCSVETKNGGDKASHHSSSLLVSGKPEDGQGGKSNVLLPQLQLPNGIPTISIAPGGGSGLVSWCESPKDGLLNGMEDDPLSEGGADGEDKPVECSICCRRFKNTPALNGHMRLHGGYFKKETESPKKKEVSKEHTHSTPLQTASVSVRALIEEKIKERRNNLLKLAAAAAAEKAAAGENGSSTEPLPQQPTAPVTNGKSKSDKGNISKSSSVDSKTPNGTPAASIVVAQQAQQQVQPCIKLSMENIKLKMEPTSSTEKDKICDHHQLINTICTNNSTNINSNVSSSSNNNGVAAVKLEPSFQDLSILIGGDGNGSIVGIDGSGIGGGISNGNIMSHNDMIMPQLVRDTVHHHPQPQQNNNILQQQSVGGTNGSLPITIDKSNNISLLDCGISPDELCQAFHFIYVDGSGAVTNGNSNMFSFSDQETLGRVTKMFQEPLPEVSSLNGGLMHNNQSTLKSVTEPILICPQSNQDDPCNFPWEWRNSASSDNTDNSLSNVQDCVNSLLCSTSSDTPDESSTKDPVAGGGFCYTPILSPNSSFCLTPGPDSPFEAVAPPNQSLSFICPSPSIGTGSTYSDPSMSSLVNPPTSVESIFSPEQSQPPSISSVNITPTAELQKYSQSMQPELQSPIFINGFDGLHHPTSNKSSQGIITVSHMAPASTPQQFHSNPPPQLAENRMDCLPPINTFPSMQTNGTHLITNNTNNFLVPKDIVLHCPNNGYTFNMPQQSFVPVEVFTPFPIPKKIVDKWMNGKVEKGRKTRVGSEFQADLPACKGNKGRNKAYRCLDEKLWDPTIFDLCTYEEVDKYLEFACCSAVPGGGMNKEYALHLLTFSKGNIREALLRLMEKLPTLPAKLRSYSYAENERWSSEEIMAFQIALIQIGKDFAKIAKSIGTKNGNECVCFYYFWKKVCPSEYQVMKQIWRDRLEHQKQLQQSQQQQQQNFNQTSFSNMNATLSSNNIISYVSNGNNNNLTSNNVSFLVPAQDFRSK